MSRPGRVSAAITVATVLFVHPLSSFAEEAPNAAPKPATETTKPAVEPAKPTLETVTCKHLSVHANWKGSGVGVVDVYGKGEPVLQLRKDPMPDQTSIDFDLPKEWEGRNIDVRIWDKDVKLLDVKSAECKAKP